MLLRFVIGAHFFHEGYNKWRDPKPFTGPFFAMAKGPFADTFHSQVWDWKGLERLDREETLALMGVAADEKGKYSVQGGGAHSLAMNHYKFDEKQDAELQQSLLAHAEAYDALVDQWAPEIKEYRYGLERQQKNDTDPGRKLTAFQKHDARIQSELMSKRMPWQSSIDKLWKGLEGDINRIATVEQQQKAGYLSLTRPGRFALDSEMMDKVIPWFHMVIGVSLVIGLLTRLSALMAAVFLATVVASQWPFTPGTVPTSYQQVEFCACLVLVGVAAGRYAGIDGLLSCCCGPRATTNYERETVAAGKLRRG